MLVRDCVIDWCPLKGSKSINVKRNLGLIKIGFMIAKKGCAL
jgi:hypothetical protein